MYQTKDVNGPSYMKSCESKVWLSTGRTSSRLLMIAVMLKLGSQIARKMAAFPVSWRGKSCHFYCKVIPNILTSNYSLFIVVIFLLFPNIKCSRNNTSHLLCYLNKFIVWLRVFHYLPWQLGL